MQSHIKSHEITIKRKNQYDKDSKDQIERIKGRIEAICLDNDIYKYEQIEELIDVLDNLEQNKKIYINPTAFVFGRYVIVSKNIDNKKLTEIFNKYSNILQDNGVEKVDVVRYARFWITTILNENKKKEKTVVVEEEDEEEKDEDEEKEDEEEKDEEKEDEDEENYEENYDDDYE
jgi:hypothetical protein